MKGRRELVVIGLILAAFLVCAWHLWLLIRSNAVNTVFWDQFDYLEPHMNDAPLWARFAWQHGPHRQGVGALLISLWYGLTDWDGRADAVGAAVLMLGAAAATLVLIRRLGLRLTLTDAAIPFLFGTIHAFEIYVGTPNAAHGPAPALLLVLMALAMTLRGPWTRSAVMLVLNFCLVFTGFAIFAGLLTPMVFAVMAFQRWADRRERAASITGAALSPLAFAVFAIGYKFQTAAECFRFPDPNPQNYPVFMALLIARPMGAIGTRGLRVYVAFAVLALVVGALIWSVNQALRHRDARALPTAFLTGFALLFCANTAIGRVCFGVDAASVPRYVPYALMGALGVYLMLRLHEWKRPRLGQALLTAVALIWVGKEWLARESNLHDIRWYADGKRRWVACYLEREDIAQCDAAADFRIFPVNDDALKRKLGFLKSHGYSFFKK